MRYYEIINEGGNAFKNPDIDNLIRRINRDEIKPTLKNIANDLKIPGIDYNYLLTHLMGSTLKGPTSGDIDIAVNAEQYYVPFAPKLVIAFPKSVLNNIAAIVRQKLGAEYVVTDGLPGGQINVAWPILGNITNGLVQVDFIHGDAEWLKFSHHSPGKDVSPYKGVWISTLMGLLAKLRKDFEAYNAAGERVARCGLQYDLEQGLHRVWEIRLKQGTSKVDPDVWETQLGKMIDTGMVVNINKVPRFSRIGYIKTPEVVIEMLLGKKYNLSDIDTFEKLWGIVKNKYPDKIDEIKDRLAEALLRSGLKNEMSKDEIVAQINAL